MDLVPTWRYGTTADGLSGITVDPDNRAINLFGSVQKVFNLTRQIQANKFTRLQYNVTALERTSNYTVGLCLYENLPQGPEVFRERCHEVQTIMYVKNASIDQLLNGKNATFQFIGIFQDSNKISHAEASISDISIIQGENTDIYDEDGKCKDKNAHTNSTGSRVVCTCKDGYTASNGGKNQGPFDTCIRCIESEKCRFDGEFCDSSSDCFANPCEDGICQARVSRRFVSGKFLFWAIVNNVAQISFHFTGTLDFYKLHR